MQDQLKPPARTPPPVKPGDVHVNVDTVGLLSAAQSLERVVAQFLGIVQQHAAAQAAFVASTEKMLKQQNERIAELLAREPPEPLNLPIKFGTRSYDVKLREDAQGNTSGFKIVARDS